MKKLWAAGLIVLALSGVGCNDENGSEGIPVYFTQEEFRLMHTSLWDQSIPFEGGSSECYVTFPEWNGNFMEAAISPSDRHKISVRVKPREEIYDYGYAFGGFSSELTVRDRVSNSHARVYLYFEVPCGVFEVKDAGNSPWLSQDNRLMLHFRYGRSQLFDAKWNVVVAWVDPFFEEDAQGVQSALLHFPDEWLEDEEGNENWREVIYRIEPTGSEKLFYRMMYELTGWPEEGDARVPRGYYPKLGTDFSLNDACIRLTRVFREQTEAGVFYYLPDPDADPVILQLNPDLQIPEEYRW